MSLSEPDRPPTRGAPCRAVVVTGASAGLGRAIALEFAREGDNVAVLARDTFRLKQVADEIEKAGGQALVLPTDVAAWSEVKASASRWSRSGDQSISGSTTR